MFSMNLIVSKASAEDQLIHWIMTPVLETFKELVNSLTKLWSWIDEFLKIL